jgi:uncharacterized membrane protein YfcA
VGYFGVLANMQTSEKIEVGLIAIVVVGVWMMAAELPAEIGAGKLLLWASGLLLLQSLVRDVSLLVKARRSARKEPQAAIRCMCVESTVGMTGIVIGTILFGIGFGQPILMGRRRWSLAALVVLGAAFLIKDFLLETKPWRIRRHKDHLNIVVKWR